MINSPKSSQPSWRNYINIVSILGVLVIAPIVSWVYLKKGIEYRKSALETLTPKSLDDNTKQFIAPYVLPDGQAKLIHLSGAKQPNMYDLVFRLDERIIEKPLFEIISIGDASGVDWPARPNNISMRRSTQEYEGPYDFVLLDTGNVVRATYKYHPELDKEIIRHLSIIIPMQPRKDIQLERQKTQDHE